MSVLRDVGRASFVIANMRANVAEAGLARAALRTPDWHGQSAFVHGECAFVHSAFAPPKAPLMLSSDWNVQAMTQAA